MYKISICAASFADYIRIQMDKRYYLYIVGGFDASLSVRHCAP